MLVLTNKILWAIATSLLILSSIYYTYKLRFIQFDFKEIFRNLKDKSTGSGLTTLETLMMTLGGKIGVGSIAGIALGIYIGGVGSILWLWIITILSSVLAYAETVLGVIYRKKDDKLNKGGPSYYITNGLGLKKLGIIYSIIIIISYIGGFLGIQANTIAKSVNAIISINPMIVGMVIIIITGLCIIGGAKEIAKVSSKLVPIMSLLYMLVVLYVVVINIDKVPGIIVSIVKSGLNFKAVHGGIITTIIVGIQRGIFSSEAGVGTAAILSASSNTKIPSKQGYVQILGVYITGLLICTATCFLILLSPYQSLILDDINGIEIISLAFTYHFGQIGNMILFVFIFLFSFSTILTGYYYGEASLNFLVSKISSKKLLLFKMIVLFLLFIGSIAPANLLWNIIDSFVAILSIINIYALLNLVEVVVLETDCYKSKNMVE